MAFQINDEILNKISEFYKVEITELQAEGGFDHLFYNYSSNGKQFFVRIKSNINFYKKSFSEIRAEVDWINYLAINGIPVSKPQMSINQKFVEQIKIDDKEYYVVSFEKAQGNYVNFSDSNEWNKDLWQLMGELIGKMHRLSTKYIPAEGNKRHQLEEDIFFTTDKILDSKKEKKIIDEFTRLKNWILNLDKPKSAYGLVHGDLNWGNFYIHNEKDLTFFDFDSCSYNWFIYDLAIFVYSLIWEKTSHEAIRFLRKFVPFFYSGYSKEYSLSDEWIILFPEFLYFHDFFLYTALSEAIQSGNNTEDYPSMLTIINKRCESGISKNYFNRGEWLDLFKINNI